MADKGGQSGQKSDEELMYLVGVCLFFLFLYIIWLFARDFILWFAFSLDIAQFWVVDKIFNFNATFKGYLEFMKGIFRSSSSPSYVDPFSINFDELMFLSGIAGNYFRWAFASVIILLGIITVFKMKGSGFSRNFSLTGKGGASLAHYQSEHWKVFSAGANFDPDADNKLEDPAATPMEWMKKHNLDLSEENGGIDVEGVTKEFENQLGDQWNDMGSTPVYVQTLCVCCYLNAKRDKGARGVKERIAIIFSTLKGKARDKALMGIINNTKKDPRFLELIEKYASKHAYINTAMFRILLWSRKNGGVFASAEFRWLKPIDRTLWYVLNNCGRRSYHTEGAGAISHFNAENISDQSLIEPEVDEAVEGLEDYFQEQGIYNLKDFFNAQSSDF
jgi:hypothetical protein